MTAPDEKAPELKEYKVVLNGQPTTVQMTEEEYEAQGYGADKDADGYATKAKPKPRFDPEAASKSKTPPNKARTEETK